MEKNQKEKLQGALERILNFKDANKIERESNGDKKKL